MDGVVYARKVTTKDAERLYDRNLIMVMRKEELIRKGRREKRLEEKKTPTFRPDIGKNKRAVPAKGAEGTQTTLSKTRTNKSLIPSSAGVKRTTGKRKSLNETRVTNAPDRAEAERRTRELESQAISNYIDRMKRGQEERDRLERARELRPRSRGPSVDSLGRTMQRSILSRMLSKSKGR